MRNVAYFFPCKKKSPADQHTKFALTFLSLTVQVRDLMHEYLKRMQINLRDPQLQLSDTRQIEIALSAQLTRLKVQSCQLSFVTNHP